MMEDLSLGVIHEMVQGVHDGHVSHYEGGNVQNHAIDNYTRALKLAREPFNMAQGRARMYPGGAITRIWHDGQYYWDI